MEFGGPYVEVASASDLPDSFWGDLHKTPACGITCANNR